MSNDKKDLTSIEDLGEFIHELDATDEVENDSSDVPDLPEEETPSETDFGTSDFGTSEEVSDFGNSGELSFETNFEENSDSTFTTNDFFGLMLYSS